MRPTRHGSVPKAFEVDPVRDTHTHTQLIDSGITRRQSITVLQFRQENEHQLVGIQNWCQSARNELNKSAAATQFARLSEKAEKQMKFSGSTSEGREEGQWWLIY